MQVAPQRRPLTSGRVIDAAVRVADEQGLDALTLRRLAEALDVHPTSIYNHLPSKESILDALAERLLTEAHLPTHYDHWQDWVREFATRMRALARRHPGAFAVFTRRAGAGPTANTHIEAALDAFRRGGFGVQNAHYAMAGTALAVMGLALNESPAPGPAPVVDTRHLTADRYPRIAEALAAPRTDTDAMWLLIIDSLVVGLQAQARS